MNTSPIKSGWYWVRRLSGDPVPEVCFWTGRRFLSIDPNYTALLPLDLTWCGDAPLQVPPEFFDVAECPLPALLRA
jgi:hypothetical protein